MWLLKLGIEGLWLLCRLRFLKWFIPDRAASWGSPERQVRGVRNRGAVSVWPRGAGVLGPGACQELRPAYNHENELGSRDSLAESWDETTALASTSTETWRRPWQRFPVKPNPDSWTTETVRQQMHFVLSVQVFWQFVMRKSRTIQICS